MPRIEFVNKNVVFFFYYFGRTRLKENSGLKFIDIEGFYVDVGQVWLAGTRGLFLNKVKLFYLLTKWV
jgi:hypothetical protein